MTSSCKNVSIGEYDPRTGLTHITQQRGRLLFNMGPSVKKRQHHDLLVEAVDLTMSSGNYTGLSLYPEEASYLSQQEALIIYLMPRKGEDAPPLSAATFDVMVLNDAHVSLACMQVYAFLKDHRLHPRRCRRPLMQSSFICDSIPCIMANSECRDVAFDVWKTMTCESAESAQRAKKRKMLMRVFKVIVCRFGDALPSMRSLRNAANSTISHNDLADNHVPLKVAVVHHDNTVLLFEVGTHDSNKTNK
ncbi:hypothetical protein CCR75_000095 [Bremia lactucae]|uniref:tRNA-splicing endonuclease subunit Sen54 N-terminal domain-containing protein n=1 Tax=Bremia lactucae TaxID=4779 RepID=A0A976IDD3_BRELC|nr:hypothetical protein CCR75_000095 [Bremia lactucae]